MTKAKKPRSASTSSPFAKYESSDFFASKPANAAVKALEEAQTLLEGVSQDDARPAGLTQLARHLVEPELARGGVFCARRPPARFESAEAFGRSPKQAEHKSWPVRLWTATCVCEVLRIFAPRAPYGDGELLGAFGLIASALRKARGGAALPRRASRGADSSARVIAN